MSAVDPRYPELDLFLQGWRSRLNLRYLGGEALVAGAWAAPVAWFLAELVGRGTPGRILVWFVVVGAAAAGWTLVRARGGLSRHQAASWLDERAGSVGLFRAASECLDAENPTPAQVEVLGAADRARPGCSGRFAPRLPWKRLAARAALASVLGAGCLVLVSVEGLSPSFGPPVPTRTAGNPVPGTKAPTPSEGSSRELSPKEAAQRLFPEDTRLAALAEQALASGDPGALDSLLEQNADRANQGSPSGAPGSRGGAGQDSPSPRDPSGSSDPRQTKPEGAPGASEGQGRPGSSPNQGDQKPGGPNQPGPKADGGHKDQASGPQTQQNSQSRGQGNGRPGDAGSGNTLPFSSGGAPGIGHSDQPLGARPPASSSGRTLPLKEQADPGLFEYVLPGSGTKVPPAQVLADSRRAAETIISRTSPPLEFENTIREYFLTLSQSPSQEVSP